MARKFWIMALGVTLAGSILVTAAGPGCVQIEGIITAVDADAQQITVGDMTVQVTPDTVLTMGAKTIAFSDLAINMTVKVCGRWDGNVLMAKKINVMYLGK